MSDTGQAAGQECELAVRLLQAGTPLEYADATEFEAAGWSLSYRAAQSAASTAGYSIAPHPVAGLAAQGWHLIVVTLINGQGPVMLVRPSSGTGWRSNPVGWHLGAESVDLDDIYGRIAIGAAAFTDEMLAQQSFAVTEGDSFVREVTVLASLLARYGFDADDIADGTLKLGGAVRGRDNRTAATPNAVLAVTVVEATAPDDAILRISWASFPTGLELGVANTDVAPIVFLYDVLAIGTLEEEITAVDGTDKTITIAGDLVRWFAVGGKFGVGLDTFTVVSATSDGTDTVITVSEAVGSLVGQDIVLTLIITLANGDITVSRQEDRRAAL